MSDLREHCERATMIMSWKPSWQQTLLGGKAQSIHISPNGAEFGSLVHAAEAWMLGHGLQILLEKWPHLYQAVIDEFCDSLDFKLFEQNLGSFYKAMYGRRDGQHE